MNRTHEILAALRSEILNGPLEELPALIGQVEALKAEAFARLVTPVSAPGDDDAGDRLLTAEEVAQRIGGNCTLRWVRDHQDQLPRVQLPGRKVRFSAKRLDAMIKRRSYG
jgi:hypothetical protein